MQNSAISRQFFPASQLGVSVGYCQRLMVDKSGMIRTRMGKHNGSEMVAVYAIPPRNTDNNKTLWC
jgi:hypothetical protein